jgi:hypothetical protein
MAGLDARNPTDSCGGSLRYRRRPNGRGPDCLRPGHRHIRSRSPWERRWTFCTMMLGMWTKTTRAGTNGTAHPQRKQRSTRCPLFAIWILRFLDLATVVWKSIGLELEQRGDAAFSKDYARLSRLEGMNHASGLHPLLQARPMIELWSTLLQLLELPGPIE